MIQVNFVSIGNVSNFITIYSQKYDELTLCSCLDANCQKITFKDQFKSKFHVIIKKITIISSLTSPPPVF